MLVNVQYTPEFVDYYEKLNIEKANNIEHLITFSIQEIMNTTKNGERFSIPNATLSLEKYEYNGTLPVIEVHLYPETKYIEPIEEFQKAFGALDNALALTMGMHGDMHQILEKHLPYEKINAIMDNLSTMIQNAKSDIERAEQVRKERNDSFTIVKE